MNADKEAGEKKSQKQPPSGGNTSTLQAHMAEYQALMTRNTFMQQWQWALIPATAAILVIVANARTAIGDDYVVWCGIIVIELAFTCHAELWLGRYAVTRYLEDLRQRVEKLLPPDSSTELSSSSVWGYEAHQIGELSKDFKRGLVWYEWVGNAIPFLLVAAGWTICGGFSGWRWFFFLVSTILALRTLWTMKRICRERNSLLLSSKRPATKDAAQ